MEAFILLVKIKDLMYFLIIMLKGMLGTIDSQYHTEASNLLTYLEVTKVLLSNYLNFLKRVNIGQHYGYQIHITGRAMSMTYFLCGSLALQVDMTLLQSTVEWS